MVKGPVTGALLLMGSWLRQNHLETGNSPLFWLPLQNRTPPDWPARLFSLTKCGITEERHDKSSMRQPASYLSNFHAR